MDKLGTSSTRVLITGSNGFLGQKLTDLIVNTTNYKLCCTSKSENRNPNIEGYTFKALDLTDFKGLEELILAFKPTHIVHTAAITSVEQCDNNPELCKVINIDSVENLTRICKELNIHFTFISTDFVFDGKNGPYNESDACNPCNSYGQSKLDAENIIQNANISSAILRTILVYGVIADKNRSNLILWAKNKLEAKEAIKVVDDQWRMPTFVDDLAQACILAIEKNANGIYQISGDTLFSVIEVVNEVANFWNLDKSLISPIHAASIGQAENRPRSTGFDLTKSKIDLGYQPTKLRDSLYIIDQQLKDLRK